MNPLQEQVAHALRPLIGLPLRGANRALSVQMFHFGARRKRLSSSGEEVEFGECALHVQCPWRVVGGESIVVGDRDRWYPADESEDWQAFDEDKDVAHLEAELNAWIEQHRHAPLKVERVESDAVGGFRLFLEESYALEAFPAHSLRGEYSEHWRIFRPSDDQSHFVVTGYGVESAS